MNYAVSATHITLVNRELWILLAEWSDSDGVMRKKVNCELYAIRERDEKTAPFLY